MLQSKIGHKVRLGFSFLMVSSKEIHYGILILSKTFFVIILIKSDSLVRIPYESNKFDSNHDLI